jgi:lysophospholipase L1-like esterase
VEGFGAEVQLSLSGGALSVQRFEVQLTQQDAYVDNIYFNSDPPPMVRYLDDFGENTISSYELAHTMTSGGFGGFQYDSAGQRAKLLTGTRIGAKIAKDVPPVTAGIFEIEILPTAKYGDGGAVFVRLLEDESNYYELKNTDPSGSGFIRKVVDGNEVERKPLPERYIQNTNYHILINVQEQGTTILAFGERLNLNSDPNQIALQRFEIEFNQQDGYIDNIRFTNIPVDYYVAVGDSITRGSGDDLTADGIGYPPILQAMLSDTKQYRHLVYNEGVSGDTSADGIARMPSLLLRYSQARFFLIQYGTNDASDSLSSGLGLNPGDAGYAGSYKDQMQQIIGMVRNAGKTVYLSKLPMASGAYSHLNTNIAIYNQVIDELVFSNSIGVVPPNLYCYFSAFPQDLSDGLHPDGSGYQAIAELWHDSLVDQSQPCN